MGEFAQEPWQASRIRPKWKEGVYNYFLLQVKRKESGSNSWLLHQDAISDLVYPASFILSITLRSINSIAIFNTSE